MILAPANVDSSAAIHSTIPPILHCVVASSMKPSGDLGPSLAHFANQLLNDLTFLGSDRVMI